MHGYFSDDPVVEERLSELLDYCTMHRPNGDLFSSHYYCGYRDAYEDRPECFQLKYYKMGYQDGLGDKKCREA